MQLRLLKFMLAHQNIRWAEYLKLLSNGRFKSECINTSRDTNKFVLRYCDPETNLWEEDLGDGHFRALVDRMKRNITHLVEEEWFGWSLEAFVSAEIEGYTMDEFESAGMFAAVKALDPKQELLPLKEIASDKIEKAIRKLCADWDPYSGSKYFHPKQLPVKMLFERMLMDNSFQFDAKKQINFSDGMCYEPGKQLVRQIEPSDGATLKMPYALPIMDDVKQTELDGYLGEIFPNKRVCDWNIAQRARSAPAAFRCRRQILWCSCRLDVLAAARIRSATSRSRPMALIMRFNLTRRCLGTAPSLTLRRRQSRCARS